MFDLAGIETGVRALWGRLELWLVSDVLTWATLAQFVAVAVGVGLALLIAKPLERRFRVVAARHWSSLPTITRLIRTLPGLAFPLAALAVLLIERIVVGTFDADFLILSAAINLLAAGIVIRFTSRLIRSDLASRTVAAFAFLIAALNILDLLEPLVAFLEGVEFGIGAVRLNLATFIAALIQFAVLLWIALALARIADHRLEHTRALTPSLQVLLGKLLRLIMIIVVFAIALRTVGVDITALAVFTGALGVGAGFGLQKLVSNLVSGLILLLDRSIKPGDVIEVGDSFGWVSSLNARYTSVTTRDGKEWLIPNEDLITERVVNWSYSNSQLRLIIPFGVAYHSDVRLVMRLAVEAAQTVPRVLSDPQPVCRLTGFGDSSVDMELRLWISDPARGVVNVRSAVLLNLWEAFHANGIEIPFPQRDVHLKTDSQVEVRRGG